MSKLPRSYRKWDSMIGRCYRPSHPHYKYYGGNGITVCDEWRHSPKQFLLDMGEPPTGMWLDRIDNKLPYCKSNCRWVTPSQSGYNRRQRQPDPNSLPSKAKRVGLPFQLVYNRMRNGWTEQQALSVPLLKQGAMTKAQREHYGLTERKYGATKVLSATELL